MASESECAAPDLSSQDEPGANTRIPRARWPESELAKLPASLRPGAGQTLELLFLRKVLLLQSRRGYRCNSDSLLLPFYAAQRVASAGRAEPSRVADVGSGPGLVGIAAALQWSGAVVTLFERQASLAALARRNLALNGLAVGGEAQDDGVAAATARARLCECDLADAGTYPHGAFDGVLCNPPFYSDGSGRGRPTRSAEKADAFFESTLDLAGFVQVLADLLRPGGHAWLVYPPENADRLDAALHACSRLRLTHVARKVHAVDGDQLDESGPRLLLELQRCDDAEEAAAEGHARRGHGAPRLQAPASEVIALHDRARGDGVYTHAIEAWLRRLPPCHYAIRTPGM